MDEVGYLRLLTRQTEQAGDFPLDARKWDHERRICRHFLEAPNVPYRQEDFTVPGKQPPDVSFKGVDFGVFLVLDENCRLNEKWREKLTRRCQAVSPCRLVHHEERPQRIATAESQARLASALCKKTRDHNEHGTDHGGLDLLAFVNLKHAVPNFNTPSPPPTEYLRRG